MINYFVYNGKDSRDMGIMIRNKQSYDGAAREVSFNSVPGRSGDIIIDNGRYNNIEITYEITIFAQYYDNISPNPNISLSHTLQDIRQWLLGDVNYHKLTDGYDPDYYRWACFDGDLTFDVINTQTAQAELTFNCKPYRYRHDGEKEIEYTSEDPFHSITREIYNPYSVSSQPYIYILGVGDIKININGSQLNIGDVDEYVEIDCETMNVYKGNSLMNNKTRGIEFPEFYPKRNNQLSFLGENEGLVYTVKIKPRWREI